MVQVTKTQDWEFVSQDSNSGCFILSVYLHSVSLSFLLVLLILESCASCVSISSHSSLSDPKCVLRTPSGDSQHPYQRKTPQNEQIVVTRYNFCGSPVYL